MVGIDNRYVFATVEDIGTTSNNAFVKANVVVTNSIGNHDNVIVYVFVQNYFGIAVKKGLCNNDV